MPVPAGVETVTVSSGEPLILPDGTPIQGRLLFTGPELVTIAADNTIVCGTTEATLADGEFSITLIATDATGMDPTGWTYKVTGQFINAPNWVKYISLPQATPSVNLSDIVAASSSSGTSFLISQTDADTRYVNVSGDTMTGDLTLSGASTDLAVGGTATVTGATSLSTLSTSGAATLNSASVTGNATVGGTLGVTGNSTLSGTLGVTGAATLSSTLAVTGASTLTGNTTVGGTLGVTGAATLSSTLGVTGATTMSTASTSGLATLNSASITNNATVGGTLTVTGAASLNAGGSFGNTMTGTGAAATSVVIGTLVAADSFDRFRILADGDMEWGPGSGARDVTLYRSGANLLKTDDKFLATAGIGVGNSAAATTPGTVTRKMEVFNASGASLGFVAIYDAIT